MLGNGYHDVPRGHVAMAVTHLEMRARANLRGTALPSGLNFEPLDRAIEPYRALFRRIGQGWLWFGRLAMTDSELRAILEDPRVQLHTLLRDGKPEALLELDFRTRGECELAYFGLTGEITGIGAGAFLMDRAIEMAWSEPIKRMHVHTCSLDSPEALGFYLRSGFAPVRRSVEIAPDPRLAGLLPMDAAPQVPIIR